MEQNETTATEKSNNNTASTETKDNNENEVVNPSPKSKTTNLSVPLKTADGADLRGGNPYVTYYNGYYYYITAYDSGKISNSILISISKNLQDIGKPEKVKKVYTGRSNIWAPELHHIGNRWYIYYTDTIEKKNNSYSDEKWNVDGRRGFVLKSKTDNPFGEYEKPVRIYDKNNDYYHIDGTVFKWNNKYYYIYSGFPTESETSKQYLYIARMKDPMTLDSGRVEIARSTYDWEKISNVNEGPQTIIHNNKLYIIYSANGANSKYYCLGMITYNGTGDLLNANSWKKYNKAVFSGTSKVISPGHASFTTSRDGKEEWIVYHASNPDNDLAIEVGVRTIRIKKFSWNGSIPNFGEPDAPVDESKSTIKIPSGSV